MNKKTVNYLSRSLFPSSFLMPYLGSGYRSGSESVFIAAIGFIVAAVIMIPIGGTTYYAVNQPYGWRKTACVPAGLPTETHTTVDSAHSYAIAYMYEEGRTGPNDTIYQMRTPPVFHYQYLFPRSPNDVDSWLSYVTCDNAKVVCYLDADSGVTNLLSKVGPICMLVFGSIFLILSPMCCFCGIRYG